MDAVGPPGRRRWCPAGQRRLPAPIPPSATNPAVVAAGPARLMAAPGLETGARSWRVSVAAMQRTSPVPVRPRSTPRPPRRPPRRQGPRGSRWQRPAHGWTSPGCRTSRLRRRRGGPTRRHRARDPDSATHPPPAAPFRAGLPETPGAAPCHHERPARQAQRSRSRPCFGEIRPNGSPSTACDHEACRRHDTMSRSVRRRWRVPVLIARYPLPSVRSGGFWLSQRGLSGLARCGTSCPSTLCLGNSSTQPQRICPSRRGTASWGIRSGLVTSTEVMLAVE